MGFSSKRREINRVKDRGQSVATFKRFKSINETSLLYLCLNSHRGWVKVSVKAASRTKASER